MTQSQIEHKYRNRMSLSPEERAEIERLYEEMLSGASAQWSGAAASDLDSADAAAVEIPEDPDIDRARSGLYANLPQMPVAAPQAEQETPATPQFNVDERVSELMRRGMDAGMASAVATAESAGPKDPMSDEPTSPAVRQAIAEENARRAGLPGPISDRQRQFDAMASESERQMANIRRLISAGVNPAQDMTAASPEDEAKFSNWARSGSLERMARYAPGDYEARMQADAAQRRRENAEMRAKRYDQTIDPETGRTMGELFIQQQRQKDQEWLQDTLPGANNALKRELRGLGIDPGQFDTTNEFDRAAALDAKRNALGAEKAMARQEARRQAMMRGNPMAYLTRPGGNADERQLAMFVLGGGKGATPNDITALNAKAFLEGVNRGMGSGLRVGDMGMQQMIAQQQMRQIALKNAQEAAESFFRERASGWWNQSLNDADYQDMIAMLGGMGLGQQEAEGIARRYRRSGPAGG